MVLFTAIECTCFHKRASVPRSILFLKFEIADVLLCYIILDVGGGIIIDLCFYNSSFVTLRSDLCDKTFS